MEQPHTSTAMIAGYLNHIFGSPLTLHQVNAFYCIFCNFYDNYATFLRQETRTNKDIHMEASSVYQDKMPQPQHAASYLCLKCTVCFHYNYSHLEVSSNTPHNRCVISISASSVSPPLSLSLPQ